VSDGLAPGDPPRPTQPATNSSASPSKSAPMSPSTGRWAGCAGAAVERPGQQGRDGPTAVASQQEPSSNTCRRSGALIAVNPLLAVAVFLTAMVVVVILIDVISTRRK